jgi:hypothetical protein
MRVLLNAVLDRLPGSRLDPDAAHMHIHGLVSDDMGGVLAHVGEPADTGLR